MEISQKLGELWLALPLKGLEAIPSFEPTGLGRQRAVRPLCDQHLRRCQSAPSAVVSSISQSFGKIKRGEVWGC
jgi:hypothetical protein